MASLGKIEHAALCRMEQQHTEGIKAQKEYKGKQLMHHNGRTLTKIMLVLESMCAWTEKQEDKPRELNADAVYSMLMLGERLPTELLHTDSLGMDLVIRYVKKFSCSREEVT